MVERDLAHLVEYVLCVPDRVRVEHRPEERGARVLLLVVPAPGHEVDPPRASRVEGAVESAERLAAALAELLDLDPGFDKKNQYRVHP